MQKLLPDYCSEPPPLTRRPWFRHAAFIVGSLVLAGASLWLWNIAAEFYWEHRALNYSEAPTLIVYEDDPTTALKLIQRSNRYSVPYIRDSRGVRNNHRQLPVAYHPEIGDKSFGTWPYLLLHGRRAGAGKRLVVVTLMLDEISDAERTLLINPFSSTPDREGVSGTGGFFIRLKHDDHLRIFAGQPSEKDDSRFYIRFELNDEPGKLIGRLEPNGEVRVWLEEGRLEIFANRKE
jgi:hypothetical protein